MQQGTWLQQVVVDETEDAARRERFPVGAALAFADLEEAGREEALDRLRTAEPVSWVPALGGWLATGYAEAREVLSPRLGLTVEAQENLVRASLGLMMLTTDAEEHTRLRAPFEHPFRMGRVGDLFGDAVMSEADDLIATIRPEGRCELGEAFAAPFAIGMTGRVLGLSLDDVARIDGLYSAFAGAMVYDGNPEPQRLANAAREELNTILLLLRHPAELVAVCEAPGLLANAIEESLRLIPPVAFIERWTPRPADIGGVAIAAGEFLGVSVLAANRDTTVFSNPLQYDVQRDNARRHLSFSFGEHYCLGAHLARIEIAGAVQRLLDSLPDLRLVTCEEPAGFAFRRPPTVELVWASPTDHYSGKVV